MLRLGILIDIKLQVCFNKTQKINNQTIWNNLTIREIFPSHSTPDTTCSFEQQITSDRWAREKKRWTSRQEEKTNGQWEWRACFRPGIAAGRSSWDRNRASQLDACDESLDLIKTNFSHLVISKLQKIIPIGSPLAQIPVHHTRRRWWIAITAFPLDAFSEGRAVVSIDLLLV